MSAKLWFGAIKVNDEKVIDLGKNNLVTLLGRMNTQVAKFPDPISNVMFMYGDSQDHIRKALNYSPDSIRYAGLTPEQIQEKKWLDGLKAEGLIQQLDPDARTILPDVCTDGEYNNAICSPECRAYEHYAMIPENRIGADSSIIEAAKLAWFNAYPLIAPHYPKWRE